MVWHNKKRDALEVSRGYINFVLLMTKSYQERNKGNRSDETRRVELSLGKRGSIFRHFSLLRKLEDRFSVTRIATDVGNIAFVSRFYELVGDIDIPRSSLRSRALALARQHSEEEEEEEEEAG